MKGWSIVTRKTCALATTAGFVTLLFLARGAWADDPVPANDGALPQGAEVVTRGPVHEAFAEPVSVNPRPNPIIHKQPPAPIEEMPPDQKPEGNNVQWIPGYFAWDETADDYLWVSGFWRDVPPGQTWTPGFWNAVDDGWQWVSGYWAPDNLQEVQYLPPPPTSIDTGPTVAAPDADSLYAPGVWVYQTGRYLWRPGFWYHARPNWFYIPAHYVWTPAGYLFVPGYWDYPLVRRGILFAPIRFERDWRFVAGWRYRPYFVLATEGLLTSLFVRPDFGRYYFGDYYEPRFTRLGIRPCFDYQITRNVPDPLFASVRWHERKDAQWERGLRELYKGRVEGTVARPPVTLALQNQVINNVTNNKVINIGPKTVQVTDPQSVLRHVTVATPLPKSDHPQFKVQPIAKAKQAEEFEAAKQLRAAAVDRQTREKKIISDNVRPTKPTDPAANVKIATPKVNVAPRVAPVQVPPHPTLPKHVEQPMPKHEVIQPVHVVPPKAPPPKAPEKKKDKGAFLFENSTLDEALASTLTRRVGEEPRSGDLALAPPALTFSTRKEKQPCFASWALWS
jgi:hypothetical protein